MIEKHYSYTNSNEKVIEKIIDDQNLHLNHAILPKGDRLPEHYSNSNVYLIITRGEMTAQLGDQESNKYSFPSMLNVPYNTKMNIINEGEETLEFFIVKTPNPANYGK
ncbi:MAG: cupin domain-containing protein [Candidatus Cloacimonetes bacterium]|nr:cupin domain-containing protein [Candidatus Cloacimonadota bacterium]MDD2651408.1 cupin domain-containing protein [Candidatus Cloacimonadota bacterium]MDD3502309.1 cupin domain-containing protein [Candidatus Cloacimonadota bacterium]